MPKTSQKKSPGRKLPYALTALLLVASSGQALSEDGAVDGSDLQVWQQSYGTSNASGHTRAPAHGGLAAKPVRKGALFPAIQKVPSDADSCILDPEDTGNCRQGKAPKQWRLAQ